MLSSVLYHLICIMTSTISAGLDEWSEVPHNQKGTWIAGRITGGMQKLPPVQILGESGVGLNTVPHVWGDLYFPAQR